MSDFIGDGQCVTHSYACDCREEHFTELEAENAKLKNALGHTEAALANWGDDEVGEVKMTAQCLQEENARLKELCRQCYRFYESIGSDLDGDHIRKAWHGSSTKAEIEQILKE